MNLLGEGIRFSHVAASLRDVEQRVSKGLAYVGTLSTDFTHG